MSDVMNKAKLSPVEQEVCFLQKVHKHKESYKAVAKCVHGARPSAEVLSKVQAASILKIYPRARGVDVLITVNITQCIF
jgi:hypothetical protein